MTFLRPASLVLVAVLLAGPAVAEPPPALIEATETAVAACTALGGTPKIVAGYEQSRDLNGDGVDDFVTDFARLECAGAWSAFCGPSGCPVTAWLSRGGGFDRFDLGRLLGFEIEDGTPLPALVARYDAVYCGESLDECTRTWRFTSNAPEQPPIDASPEVNAEGAKADAVAPADAARTPTPDGWTLRRVPGSSPVALGMGTGGIATFAGFCLSGQPFLAVTFHERPAAETVRLSFAFSEGELATDASYEETAGGAYVIALADGPLARRLGGRDAEVAVSVDGERQGVLSLRGSTKALRGALADCHGF
jgi:hypothetical protein